MTHLHVEYQKTKAYSSHSFFIVLRPCRIRNSTEHSPTPGCNKSSAVVCFLLGNSPASEIYMPTFRKTLSLLSSQADRFFIPILQWRRNRQIFPKRGRIKFRRRGITQKKSYKIQNTAIAWNQKIHGWSTNSYNFFFGGRGITVTTRFTSIILSSKTVCKGQNCKTKLISHHFLFLSDILSH